MTMQWRRVGFRAGDRTAILRGTVVRGERLFERAPSRTALIMSSYHLTEDRLPLYLAKLRQFRPRFLRAYPSAATLVARFMLEHAEPPVQGLEAILCGSEISMLATPPDRGGVRSSGLQLVRPVRARLPCRRMRTRHTSPHLPSVRNHRTT